MSIVKSKLSTGVTNRSTVDLSHYHHGTTDFGRLDPVTLISACPDDDFEINLASFFRAAPLAAPTFGKVTQDISFFYIPYRIASDTFKFDEWLVDNKVAGSNIVLPRISAYWIVRACATYDSMATIAPEVLGQIKERRRILTGLGYPSIYVCTTVDTTTNKYYDGNGNELTLTALTSKFFSAYPLWCYYAVYLKYFAKDDSNYTKLNTGDLSQTLRELLIKTQYGRFAADPFTRAQAQPYSSGSKISSNSRLSANVLKYQNPGGSSSTSVASNGVTSVDSDNSGFSSSSVFTDTGIFRINGSTALGETSPSPAAFGGEAYTTVGVSAMDIRWSQKFLRILERYNVAGLRFVDKFLARFGAKLSTERMGIPQYLGSCRGVMEIGDLTTTNTSAGTTAGQPFETELTNGTYNGQITGKGVLQCNGTFKFHADEYGLVLGISLIRPVIGYAQGIPVDLRVITDPSDLLIPEYDNLGFQPITKDYLYGNIEQASDTFGYVPRYSMYKWHNNTISGDYVDKDTNTGMESYHLMRLFSSAPSLTNFDVCGLDMRHQFDRIFTIPGSYAGQYDHFNGVYRIDCKVQRNCSSDILPQNAEDLGAKQVAMTLGGNTI